MRRVLILLAVLLTLSAPAQAQTKTQCGMVMTASAADAFYSWNAVHDGRAWEANPVWRDAITWPRAPFVGAKVLLTIPVCVAITQQKTPRDKWIVTGAATALYTFLAYKAKHIK